MQPSTPSTPSKDPSTTVLTSSPTSQQSAHSLVATQDMSVETAPIDIIPVGIVHRHRDQFEMRISAQPCPSDLVFLTRALNYTHRHLYGTDRTYADQLRIAEQLGLSNMTTPIAQFIRIHDDMSRAVSRTYQMSMRVQRNAAVDVLIQAEIRILHMHNTVLHANIISTMSGSIPQAMRVAGDFDVEARTLKWLLIDEFVRTLTQWDERVTNDLADHELENVGPDHDIKTIGEDVKPSPVQYGVCTGFSPHSPTPSLPLSTPTEVMSMEALMNESDDGYDDEDSEDRRCSICIEPYIIDTHRAFRLTACGHVFGKNCLSRWVNSIARNANTCPQCRTVLCVRRPRRPVGAIDIHTFPAMPDQTALQARLNRIVRRFRHLAYAYRTLWGSNPREAFYDSCFTELNYFFFNQNLGWHIFVDELSEMGWRMRRVGWHEED